MVLEPDKPQPVSFRGEVVEIFERGGNRLARIMLESRDILDVAAESMAEAHLGDKVIIDASITIRGIKPD